MALDPSSGWSYYKQIDISDSANVSADYQMKLKVYSGDGDDNTADGIIYCDNHCEDFPNDIRFGTTNKPSTATQLAQWIEESDATSATIWVKCPSDGSNTFYMFVGNSSASQYSSADDTFIYFTHFDTDKSEDFRTVGGANFTWETSNSRLKGKNTSNTWHMHQLKTTYSRPIAIEARFQQNYLDWQCDGGIGYGKSSTTSINNYDEIEGYHFNLRSSVRMTLRITKTSGYLENYQTNEGTFSTNTWYRVTLELGTSEIHAYVYDDNDDKLEVTHSDSTFNNLYPGVDGDIDGGTVYWDFFFIRKHADSEPTWSSFGSWTEISGQEYSKTLTDSLSLTPSLLRYITVLKEETTSLSDSRCSRIGILKQDPLFLYDYLSKLPHVSWSEGINLADYKIFFLVKALIEVTNLSDLILNRLAIVKTAFLSPNDSLFAKRLREGLLEDVFTLSAFLQKQTAFSRLESLYLTPYLVKVLRQLLADSIMLSDSLIIGFSGALLLTDDLYFSPAVFLGIGKEKLFCDSLGLSGFLALSAPISLTDILSLSDLVRRVAKIFGNLKITTKNETLSVWCSRWQEENYTITIEFIADKNSRDKLLSDIVPGAVAELYNILGEPKFIDTTYSNQNTLVLKPKRGLFSLKSPVTAAVRRYAETMIRWDLFKIKLECVKL